MEDPPEMVLRKELGAGETAVIALALKTKADFVIRDDLAARNVAAEQGLPVTGTIGVLLAAHQKRILPDLQGVVNALKSSGFRISDAVIASILKIIG